MPITDSDVRAYLAERWSRSQPKEAALDYVSDGTWRDAREDAQHPQRGTGEAQRGAGQDRAAANDNALARIARDIRHTVNGWRFGAAVGAFAAERSAVMAAWDDLRARVRDEGEAVALSPAFRETLDRHDALMKQAASFGARPRTFERLLSERAGIGDGELRELREVHARAGSYLRSAAAKAAHARQNAGAESEQARWNAQRAPEPAQRNAPVAAEIARPDPPAAPTSQDTGRKTAPVPPTAEAPARSEAPGPDLSRAAYRWLRRDWQAHLDRAETQGEHRFDLDGAGALVERIAAFAGSEALAAETRARLGEIVGEYRAHAAARERVRGFLRDVERHWLRYHAISRRARNLDIDPREQRSWPIWLDRNERLLREGRAILDDPATYGRASRPHRRRTRAPVGRGVPDGAVLVGVPHGVPVPRQGTLVEHVSAVEEKRNVPANALRKRGTMTRRSPPTGHYALVGVDYVVHYRWHALSRQRVRVQAIENPSGIPIATVELQPGVVTKIATWMLDPVECAGMQMGAAQASLAALTALHELLIAQGIQRTSQDDRTVVGETRDEADATTAQTAARAPSTRDAARCAEATRIHRKRTTRGARSAGQPGAGSRFHRGEGG